MTADTIQALREVCHCGHDKSSHHDKRHACLCTGCDCGGYADHSGPLVRLRTPAKLPRDKPSRTVTTTTWGYLGPEKHTEQVDPSDTCEGGAACVCFLP